MSEPVSRAVTTASQSIPIVNIYGNKSHLDKIHVREQKGLFQRIRKSSNSLLIMVFFLLPFINYQGRQAILFDVTKQQFFFFDVTLWPQDFTVLAWVFMAAAFGLFFITVYWGRVWCGFLCPQTAWTAMFMWLEAKVEGNHHHRSALDKAPLSIAKIRKRFIKHSLWMLTALVTGCGFMGYFMPARALYIDIFTLSSGFWTGVWVWFFAICTYINAGWMREMMCLHCCPYSRFQAVMFDSNTKTVSYDAMRGETRGPRKRINKSEQAVVINNAEKSIESALGDCVDCHLCVDVCPTGIDIRNGLQYECINCGACVDACNQTMDKFGYQQNLISFTSENALKGEAKPSIWSVKAVGYASALIIMLLLIVMDIYQRSDIQLNVIRDRQSLYREISDTVTENSYLLKIRNKTQQAAVYRISVIATDDSQSQSQSQSQFEIPNDTLVMIKAAEQLEYPLTVRRTVIINPNTIVSQSSASMDEANNASKSFDHLEFVITEVTPKGMVTSAQLNQVSQESRFFRP
ncbi:cytochrome c oxidase accessory protein CcoG [Shewanella sp. 10N.286.48.B5]|uniref:cytochrome c oxidase accessory protein CcoG n=1 Tax=Shewanella sp. 10N.286.48.B5 TaxID=1880834 RepID=UPI000C852ACC|nr:cytochrome c oxidase accessory protein CcoG [Shewanella sp. 10N.286.48.B5]PMH86123.1 cytochrome c oxidase accessory protein CcoG [Shewanella sp. 10N.286.48.B5]